MQPLYWEKKSNKALEEIMGLLANSRKLRIILILSLFFLLLICSVSYADSSGRCGRSITWTLTDGGILTVSGDGEMYSKYSSSATWWTASKVKIVIIDGDITNISQNAFANCENLTKINLL